MTRAKLREKLKGVGPLSKYARNSVVCALIGHSMIQDSCFGYYHCGRCGEQVGDSLASSYPAAKDVVVIDHNCAKCRANYKKLTWRDKLYVKNPF